MRMRLTIKLGDAVILDTGRTVKWKVCLINKYWDIHGKEEALLQVSRPILFGFFTQRKWILKSSIYGAFRPPEDSEE